MIASKPAAKPAGATPEFIAILGATGSGKSSFAEDLAVKHNGEIVSCDSVQIYRGFDIGSAKPSLTTRTQIRHHLIDILDWQDSFDAAQYRKAARQAIIDISARGHLPIVVGGTGLYFRSLIGETFHDLPHNPDLRQELAQRGPDENLADLQARDPERARSLHPNDHFRIQRALEIAILTGRTFADATAERAGEVFLPTRTFVRRLPPTDLRTRIAERTDRMLADGLIGEVESLLKSGCPAACKPMQSIGYKQVCALLAGTLAQKDLRQKIIEATWQYARRQKNWNRRLEESPG